MRKITFSLVILVLIGLVFGGCEKNMSKEVDNSITESGTEITSDQVKILLSNIVKLSGNDAFKKGLYRKVDERFDGDDNALLKQLNTLDCIRNNRSESNTEFGDLISELENKGYYPQVYIPKFDELKKRKKRAIDQNETIFIIDGLKSTDDVVNFQGYYLDETGEIEKTDFLIDEAFASRNEVWVLSLNERQNELVNYIDGDGGGSGSSTTTASNSIYMTKIKCPNLSKIESWVKGAPELRCVMKTARGDIGEQFFYPSKRRYINDEWWSVSDSGRYLYYWDIETYTKTVYFNWVEVDGYGDSVKISGSFSYVDENKDTNETFTANMNFEYTIRSWDKACGAISSYIDDGKMGKVYSTGLVEFVNTRK